MKHFYAIYYGEGQGSLAKVRANVLRGEKHNALVLDAQMFKDTEANVDRIEFIGVGDKTQAFIRSAYAGQAVTGEEAAKEPERIPVPAAWRKLSWTKMQALASEIEPQATIRNKDEARKIIAEYVGEDPED